MSRKKDLANMPIDELIRLVFRTQERIERESGCNLGVTFTMTPKSSLQAAAPDLLALARQYASECAECGGEGSIAVSDDPVAAGLQMVCTACADIWAVIDKAEGRA